MVVPPISNPKWSFLVGKPIIFGHFGEKLSLTFHHHLVWLSFSSKVRVTASRTDLVFNKHNEKRKNMEMGPAGSVTMVYIYIHTYIWNIYYICGIYTYIYIIKWTNEYHMDTWWNHKTKKNTSTLETIHPKISSNGNVSCFLAMHQSNCHRQL